MLIFFFLLGFAQNLSVEEFVCLNPSNGAMSVPIVPEKGGFG